MSRAGVLFVMLACVVTAPIDASAQSSETDQEGVAATSSTVDMTAAQRLRPAALSLTSSIRGEQFAELLAPEPEGPALPQARNRAGVPLMVAGGILFVAGAIVSGDAGTILLLGGAGIGAYGAYMYFGG